MSASIHDIALSITSNGERSYYCGVKGIGSILLEPQLGLYENYKPKSDTALDFLKHTSWRDAYKKLSTPLADPIYGLIDINFDTKIINFATDYGIPNFMFFQWLLHSTQYAVTKNKKEHEAAFLSPLAIKEHFKHQRFEFHGMGKIGHYPIHLQYPDTLEEFATLLQTEEARRFNDENKITQIIVKLPEDWLFEFPTKE